VSVGREQLKPGTQVGQLSTRLNDRYSPGAPLIF